VPPEEEPDIGSLANVRNPGLPLGIRAMPVLVAGFDRNQNPFSVGARLSFFLAIILISLGPAGLTSEGPAGLISGPIAKPCSISHSAVSRGKLYHWPASS
jgi:hypothetical protein